MAIPSGINYFMDDSSTFENPRRNESCLICHKRLLSPTKRSAREETSSEETPPDEILKQIASILEVSPRIYRDIGIGEVPGPVLCTSCTRTVADAYNCKQAIKTLESQLKRLTEIVKGEFIHSFRLDTAKEIVNQMGTDCMEIKLIRKTYAQCLGICEVQARPCDAVNNSMHFDDKCLSSLSGPVDLNVDGIDDDYYSDMENNTCDPLNVSTTVMDNNSGDQVGPSTQMQVLGQTKFLLSFFVPEVPATLPDTSNLPHASKGRKLLTCHRCGKPFTKSSALKSHLNKKNPCVPIGGEIRTAVVESTFVGITAEENILQSNVVTPDVKIEALGNSEILDESSECKYDPSASIAGDESQPTTGSLARVCKVQENRMAGSYDESDSVDNFEPAEGTDSDSSYSEHEEREYKRIRSSASQKNKSLDCTLTSNLDCLICPNCNFRSQNLIELWTHRRKEHGFNFSRSPNCGSAFKCEICGCMYAGYRGLYEHVKIKHTGFQFSCNICGLEFECRSRFNKHKEEGHAKHSENNICKKVVPEGKLRERLEMQDGNGDSLNSEFEERESKKSRSNANQKNKSLESSLTSNLDSLKCPQCNFRSQNLLDIWTHRRKVHGFIFRKFPNCGSKFKCEICGSIYFQFRGLYEHVKIKHTEFQFSCDICGLEFENRSSFNKHREVGHAKFSKCHFCGDVFLEGKLQEHLEMHDGSADFPCKRCPKRLATSRALIAHGRKYHPEGIQTKVFSCKVCPMKFDKFPDFLDHKKDHQQQLKQRTFKCSLCSVYFKREAVLQAHMKYHADGSKKFKCNFCSETFDKIPQARDHMNTVHAKEKEAVLACTICGEKLSTKERLQKHLDNHKGEKNFPCKSCPAQFSKEAGLRAHLLRRHRPNVRCGVCHRICSSYSELVAHKKSEHGLDIFTCIREKRHKCTLCPKSFTKKIVLTNHLKLHAGKENFNCTICDAVFKTTLRLKLHLGLHKKGKIPEEKVFKFKCEICEKTLNAEDAIERHMKAHANGTEEFIFKYIEVKVDDDKNLVSFYCKVCKETFTRGSYTNNENQLEIICEHGNCGRRETFTDFKEFMYHHKKVCRMSYALVHLKAAMLSRCDECDKEFKTPKCLYVHNQVHHPGPRSLMCEICGRAFGVPNLLERHMEMHSTELNFQCHVCGNKFKSKRSLDSHINLNHRKPRFHCGICKKQFKTSVHFRNHKDAVHSKAKPQFPCHICGKLFKTKPYVLNHIYSTHDNRRKRRHRQGSEHGDQEESHSYD